jgi:hypothetical protein
MLLDEVMPEFDVRTLVALRALPMLFSAPRHTWRRVRAEAGEHRGVSPESSREAGALGTARAAWSFAVRPGTRGRTVLTTVMCVLCADPATRRRFRSYWAVIAPFSGLIRREMLAAVRSAAQGVPHIN